MKSKTEILNEIIDLQNLIPKIQKDYDSLDQISMLSEEGNQLRKQMDYLDGRLNGLRWVLDIK